MSENNVLHAGVYEHCRRDLSCVCSALLKVHILSAYLDVCSLYRLNDRYDVDRRYAEHYVHFLVCNERF